MFYFFENPVWHAKRALRNSGLTDKETSQKHQNVIGNIYAFFLSHVIFMYLEQVWLQRSCCYNFNKTNSTSLKALDLSQTRSVHVLFTSTMWKRYFSYQSIFLMNTLLIFLWKNSVYQTGFNRECSRTKIKRCCLNKPTMNQLWYLDFSYRFCWQG